MLVRHGQASFAVDRYDRLSELGVAQSRALGAWAGGSAGRWSALRHGPRRRHADTASELSKAAGLSLGLQFDEGIDEFAEGEEILAAAGELFGRPMQGPDAPPRAEQLRCYEAAYQAWARGELEIAGRESYREFRRRICRWLDGVTDGGGEPGGRHLIAVSSAGVICAVVCEVLDLPDQQWTALIRVIQNASLTEVLFSNGRRGLKRFNCTGHLPSGLGSTI